MAAGIREIQPLAVVGIISARFAVIRGCLVGENRFRSVGNKAAPDFVKARFELVRTIVHDVSERSRGVCEIGGVHLNAALVRFRRPLGRSPRLCISRRQGQQRDG